MMMLRDAMFEQDPSLVTGFYYDKLPILKKSMLFEVLKQMPKPAVHHVHLTAAAPLDFLIRLTYYDYVYFNDREKLFKVSKKGIHQEGFQKVTTIRKYWSTTADFDNYLRDIITLNRESICCKESHSIWNDFQPKFMLTCGKISYFQV